MVALLLGVVADVSATIVVDGMVAGAAVQSPQRRMRTVILMSNSNIQADDSHELQRGMAWRSVGISNAQRTLVLGMPRATVYGPESAAALRQMNVQHHIGRANAYRLNYFRK